MKEIGIDKQLKKTFVNASLAIALAWTASMARPKYAFADNLSGPQDGICEIPTDASYYDFYIYNFETKQSDKHTLHNDWTDVAVFYNYLGLVGNFSTKVVTWDVPDGSTDVVGTEWSSGEIWDCTQAAYEYLNPPTATSIPTETAVTTQVPTDFPATESPILEGNGTCDIPKDGIYKIVYSTGVVRFVNSFQELPENVFGSFVVSITAYNRNRTLDNQYQNNPLDDGYAWLSVWSNAEVTDCVKVWPWPTPEVGPTVTITPVVPEDYLPESNMGTVLPIAGLGLVAILGTLFYFEVYKKWRSRSQIKRVEKDIEAMVQQAETLVARKMDQVDQLDAHARQVVYMINQQNRKFLDQASITISDVPASQLVRTLEVSLGDLSADFDPQKIAANILGIRNRMETQIAETGENQDLLKMWITFERLNQRALEKGISKKVSPDKLLIFENGMRIADLNIRTLSKIKS